MMESRGYVNNILVKGFTESHGYIRTRIRTRRRRGIIIFSNALLAH